MIIRRIYLGEKPIRLIYLNGILTDYGCSLVGKSRSDVYSLASLLSAKAIFIDSVALSRFNGDASADAKKIVLLESKTETKVDAVGDLVTIYIVSMEAEAPSDSYAKAVCYAYIYIRLGPVTVPIKTETFARAYSHRAAKGASKVPIDTEAFAEILRHFAPLPLEADGYDFTTYADAEAQGIAPIDMVYGNGESKNYGEGNLVLLYLPVLENNVLKIRSAYDASVLDGVLEVI